MTTPDVTRMAEAVELAARELVRHERAGCCTFGKVCGLCDCFSDLDGGKQRDAYALQHAEAALSAAYPVLLAGIAEAIEAQIPHRTEFEPYTATCIRGAYTLAAAIARAYGSSEL